MNLAWKMLWKPPELHSFNAVLNKLMTLKSATYLMHLNKINHEDTTWCQRSMFMFEASSVALMSAWVCTKWCPTDQPRCEFPEGDLCTTEASRWIHVYNSLLRTTLYPAVPRDEEELGLGFVDVLREGRSAWMSTLWLQQDNLGLSRTQPASR